MTKEFVTLPREVLEQALNALDAGVKISPNSVLHDRLRAALEQPQNHVLDAGNMVPVGWKLVPVEPTDEMVEAGDHEIEKWGVDASSSGAFRAMLAAAPQPPTVNESLTTQPQGEQEPVGEAAFMPGTTGFTMACFLASDVSVGTKLYTHPQPKREPLTDEEIADGLNFAIENATQCERAAFRKGIKFSERSHGIGTAASAPKPPAPNQPQANQPAMTPIAQRKLDSLLTEGYTISGYSIYHEQKHQHGFVTGAGLVGWWRPDGVEHPQPLGEQEPVALLADAIRSEPTELIHKWRVLELIQDHVKQQPLDG